MVYSNCRPSFPVFMRERQQSQFTGNPRGRRAKKAEPCEKGPRSCFETAAGARSRKEIRRGWLTGTTFGKWCWSEDPLHRTICEEMAGAKVLSLGLRLQASALVWCSWNDTQPISWRQDSRGGVGGGDSVYCV